MSLKENILAEFKRTQKTYIGFDLGTSSNVVAVLCPEDSTIKNIEFNRRFQLPNVAMIENIVDENTYDVIYGLQADGLDPDPLKSEIFIAELKRVVFKDNLVPIGAFHGESIPENESSEVKAVRLEYKRVFNSLSFKVSRNAKSELCAHIKISNKIVDIPLKDIYAHMVRGALDLVQDELKKINCAIDAKSVLVFTVPDSYRPSQRQMLTDMFNSHLFTDLGITSENIRTQTEAKSAVMYPLIFDSALMTHTKTEPANVLLVDLGAGTLDISLIKVEENDIQIIKSKGYPNFGGSSFTDELMVFVANKFDVKTGSGPRLQKVTDGMRKFMGGAGALVPLRRECDRVKCALCSGAKRISGQFVRGSPKNPETQQVMNLQITSDTVQELFEGKTQDLIGYLKDFIENNEMTGKVDFGILTGGGFLNKPLAERVKSAELFKQLLLGNCVSSDIMVANGAIISQVMMDMISQVPDAPEQVAIDSGEQGSGNSIDQPFNCAFGKIDIKTPNTALTYHDMDWSRVYYLCILDSGKTKTIPIIPQKHETNTFYTLRIGGFSTPFISTNDDIQIHLTTSPDPELYEGLVVVLDRSYAPTGSFKNISFYLSMGIVKGKLAIKLRVTNDRTYILMYDFMLFKLLEVMSFVHDMTGLRRQVVSVSRLAEAIE